MSLIEIIMVIVLIGAVLAFVGSRVLGGADRAKANLAKAQVQTLAGKVEQYQMDTGRLPARWMTWSTQPGDAGGWLGPYAKAAELKDPVGPPDRVPRARRAAARSTWSVLGEDGKAGGNSVDADIKYE